MATWRHRGFAAAAVLYLLVACGGEDARPMVKVPVTTKSAEARSAYLTGRDLFEALRVTDAHGYFVRATELDPDFALAWMAVANTSSTNPEFFAAMRRAVAASVTASDGERMMITAFEAAVNGEYTVRKAELEQLVAAYPDDERARNALGGFHLDQQRYEEAAAEYRRAIAINPEFSPPHNQLGYALRFLGDFKGAEAAFRRYIQLIPDQPNPYDSYAELLMKMGRFEASIENYERALEIEPSFVPSYIGIANDLIFLDRPADARQALERLDAVARTDAERRLRCIWTAATFLHEGDFEQAIAEIRERHQIAAATDDRAAMSVDLNLIGDILCAAGRLDEAAARYDESVAMIDSSDATEDIKQAVHRNLIYERARIALARGDLDLAAALTADYRAAAAPLGVLAELQQARELSGRVALEGGDPKAALFELANANQQNPLVLLLNARAFAAAGDRDAARAACLQVVDFNQLNLNLAYARGPARQLLASL